LCYSLHFEREKKKVKGARIRDLQQKIRLAEVQLQRDPKAEPARDILSVAQGHLADSLQEKVARNHQLSSASCSGMETLAQNVSLTFIASGESIRFSKSSKLRGGDHRLGGPGPLRPLFLHPLIHLGGQRPRHL
jgi:hypothetical protein